MVSHIGIIGGGFSGTMLVRHLVSQTDSPLKINLFSTSNEISKGTAYNPNSNKLLLNVIASKMSAFQDKPEHFVNWCFTNSISDQSNAPLLANSFLPRAIYGRYLNDVWSETKALAIKNGHQLDVIAERIEKIEYQNHKYKLTTINQISEVEIVVLATGNELPGNPDIKNIDFFNCELYQQNPWRIDFLKIKSEHPILIIGNGLTMVDTVIELRENGFSQTIVSVSPNGFNILPHRNFNFQYKGPLNEISESQSLLDLVQMIRKELKRLKSFGISAEPLIDILRPKTQKIWQNFTEAEKRLFMKKLRHLWGVARHRIPFVSYDFIQKERIENKLQITAGKLIDLRKENNSVTAEILDKKSNTIFKSSFSIVINCTGPETNIDRTQNELLRQLKSDGMIKQDELKLGLQVNDLFQILDREGNTHEKMYAIGNLLKGKLWESTAINELRGQASQIALQIIKQISKA